MKRFILAIFCVIAVAASFLAQVQPGKLAGLIQAGNRNVEMANAYRSMVLTNDNRPTEMMPRAKAAAIKAVELDDTLAEAWTALANTAFWYDWDWKVAETHFRKGLELDHSSAQAHALYAHLLSNIGRHEEAVPEIKQARELDPPSLITNAMEGQILFFAGRDEAEKVLRATIDLDPNFWLAHLWYFACLP